MLAELVMTRSGGIQRMRRWSMFLREGFAEASGAGSGVMGGDALAHPVCRDSGPGAWTTLVAETKSAC